MTKAPIKCIIVAAGMSTRLRPQTDALPKCLLTIGGKTILERTIANLLDASITEIGLVVGFEAPKIRTYLGQRFPDRRFRYMLNPNFRSTNNAYSLLLAREFFLGTGKRSRVFSNLFLLDSDIIFHRHLISRMLESEGGCKAAVRLLGQHDEEEVHVKLDDVGCITKIGKDVSLRFSDGESVGVELFDNEAGRSLFDVLERRIKEGPGRIEYYEQAFQEMIDLGLRIKSVDVGDLPLAEIDSPEDLEHAERVVIPKIDGLSDV